MKHLILAAFFLISGFALRAQDEGNDRAEKIEALKIAFITQKLDLSAAEAEKFWPVYNQYNNDIKHLVQANKNGDVLENEQKLLDIRKKYKPSFEKILGPQKINNLFNAERDFRNVLIRRLKNRNQQRLR